jgi:hypothetical protein
MTHHLYLIIAACIMLLSAPAPASALYLDPSTGSMVLQIAVGGLLAAVAALRLYWHKLASLFRSRDKASEQKVSDQR